MENEEEEGVHCEWLNPGDVVICKSTLDAFLKQKDEIKELKEELHRQQGLVAIKDKLLDESYQIKVILDHEKAGEELEAMFLAFWQNHKKDADIDGFLYCPYECAKQQGVCDRKDWLGTEEGYQKAIQEDKEWKEGAYCDVCEFCKTALKLIEREF